MPLDAEGGWTRDLVVPGGDILRQIDRVFPLEPVAEPRPEPATRFRFKDGRGGVGFINSVTEPFCTSCNRIRLTADGMLKPCLHSNGEVPLDFSRLEESLREAVLAKPLHGGSCTNRSMPQIGG